MLKVETFKNFGGFGTGGQPGEYFYSQGMNKSQFGVVSGWKVAKVKDNADSGMSSLSLINFFTQGNFGSTNYVYGFDASGNLYRSTLGLGNWSLERTVNSVSSHGNGLLFDQKNRLLYRNDRYLGMTSDGSSFTDNWKDLGASYSTTDLCQMDNYEDWVVIANLNAVAVLNVTDDSLNNVALNLPAGYKVRCVRAGRTGILIGLNFNNKGAVLLWEPNYTRSIAPWVWFNANIKAIIPSDEGWIVITSRGIYLTNGYTRTDILETLPDTRKNSGSILNNLLPQGAETVEQYLAFWGGGSFNRNKAGLWLLDLNTKLFEFAPASNDVTYNVTGGAIFFDNNFTTHLSFTTNTPSKKIIGKLNNINPSHALLITEPLGQGGSTKVAEGVKLSFGLDTKQYETPVLTFDVSVKIANLTRNIWNYAQTRAASASANILKIDGTLFSYHARVGDEVTVLEGVNAGQVRHILSVANAGLNTEEWTLDSALPSNTEINVYLSIAPFKLVKKYSFNNISELKELYFDVQNRIKGKKFLVEILLENLQSNLELELYEGQLIYDELSLKR
ncbi:MAG: hypothetical protein AB7U82_01135 [Blastocatellales bacterium]